MAPASNAHAGISAAIGAAAQTFATRSRRGQQQDSAPPPSGADSSYGVRSLDNSVEWAESDSGASEAGSRSGSSSRDWEDDRVSEHNRRHNDSCSRSERDITPMAASGPLPVLSASSTLSETRYTEDADNALLMSASLSSRTIPATAVPPPTPRTPNETPTPPAHLGASTTRAKPSTSPSTPARSAIKAMPPSVATHALFDMLADAPSASEPSSPASLESYPSGIASLSSLSRTSSPLDWDWRHPLSRSMLALDLDGGERRGLETLGLEPRGGSAELVLPTLSLPSTSLHLGLERWPGPGSGTRVALLAGPERTRDVLGALAAKRKCVQLAHGDVGVVKDGQLQATVLTGLSVADVRHRASEAYSALHSLLNPSTSETQRAQLHGMVSSYSARADWIHLAVALDDVDTGDVRVPFTTLAQEDARLEAEKTKARVTEAALAEAAEATVETGEARSPSPPKSRRSSSTSTRSNSSTRAVDDTPRAMVSEPPEWRFPALPDVEEHAPSEVDRAVDLLERILDTPARTTSASVSAFFTHRPDPATPESHESPVNSPVPTVHTAGAGEWEATLSRRLAHRRELDAAARRARAQQAQAASQPAAVARGRPRRRRSHSPTYTPAAPHCGPGPLFPRKSMSTASVGLRDMAEKVFAPVRRVLGRTSWTSVFVACAVALAVGCGYWVVRVRG